MEPGDIVSYMVMCAEEGVSLQRGMNFQLRAGTSVLLMSRRPGAPYSDSVEDEGRTLIYEGHDCVRSPDRPDPKSVDQPWATPGGAATQNALFSTAATRYRDGLAPPERVRVYEKIRVGIWVYNGVFELVDAWREASGGREVFKFRLRQASDGTEDTSKPLDLSHGRLIPTAVKLDVWQRDKGRCVVCGSEDNLHFDHVIPFSKGGSSLVSENVQLLCARHNLAKRDSIE